MKTIFNILLLTLTIYSCKAQSIIVPLGSGADYKDNPNYHLKDVNNELGKFTGTWKYTNGNTEITFKLKKEEHYQISNGSYFEDLLVGEYQYKENGIEIANTLPDFDNPLVSGYGHHINGGVFSHRPWLLSACIDNSNPAEIKIELIINHPTQEDTEGKIVLRYVNDNGLEKLEACIYDNTTMGDIPNARIDIPNGYFVFVKQ